VPGRCWWGDTLTSIAWTQTAGPTVTMNTEDQRLLMFKAPSTTSDVQLKFRATMTTSSGKVDFDEVIISLDRQDPVPADALFERTQRVHPYRTVSQYAPVLVRCVYEGNIYYTDSNRNNFCPTSMLPLLQTEAGIGAVPTVAQIMGRVLVSHDFLGVNFETFLNTQDPNGDFRRMLAGTTAIVLGSHVRPSFYTAGSGAIYLDANNLWLTPEQRDVVTEVPDYRSSFDDALNFTSVGRAVKNNDYARRTFSPTERLTRTQSDLVLVLGRLMYHELAHASDFFSPADRTLDPAKSIWLNVVGRVVAKTLPSDTLAAQYPLRSAEMKGLADVMYKGTVANATQRAYTAAQVGGFFGSDIASDDYAYTVNGNDNSREDLAMLFEEFMMYHRHGIQYDVGYTNVFRDGMTNNDLIVAWGQRGRIGATGIKPRIRQVLARIAPWVDAGAVDSLPAPLQMRVGVSWEANLTQGNILANGARQSAMRVETVESRQARTREDVASKRHAR